MLGVDERRLAARLLHLADDVQRDRRFARRFRPYISMMRPLGTPPMPSAISSDSDPVDTPLTSIF